MVTDLTVSACRAALLAACRNSFFRPKRMAVAQTWVQVDDAAACMAEREAKLLATLRELRDDLDWLVHLNRGVGKGGDGPDAGEWGAAWEKAETTLAALAAAQEAP